MQKCPSFTLFFLDAIGLTNHHQTAYLYSVVIKQVLHEDDQTFNPFFSLCDGS